MKTYRMDQLEWCGGRMAHLRVKGEWNTVCGADPAAYGPQLKRQTLTEEQVADYHKCKSCLKRVKP